MMNKIPVFIALLVSLTSTALALQSSGTNYDINFFFGSAGSDSQGTLYEVHTGIGQNIIGNTTNNVTDTDIGLYYTTVATNSVTTTTASTTTIAYFNFSIEDYGLEWIKLVW